MVLSTFNIHLELFYSFSYTNIFKRESFVKHYFLINYLLFSISYALYG